MGSRRNRSSVNKQVRNKVQKNEMEVDSELTYDSAVNSYISEGGSSREPNIRLSDSKEVSLNTEHVHSDDVEQPRTEDYATLEVQREDTTKSSPNGREDFNESGYFQDDHDFLAGDDEEIFKSPEISIFKQKDNVVSWEIENFLKEDGTVRNRISLRTDPPIFKISSSNGDSAEFLLTRDLSASFEKIFGDVYKSYFGVNPSEKSKKFSQESVKEYFDNSLSWVSDHRIKASFISLLFVFILFSAIFR